MNIEAVIGGDLLTVASLILEQYNLKKLLGNIEDLCFDQPIRQAIKVRVEVMLPWETSNANNTICSTSLSSLHTQSDQVSITSSQCSSRPSY